MALLMKVTDSMDDDVPTIYDLDDPKQNADFRQYCHDVGRMAEGRDGYYPGDRVTIECIGRDD